MNLPLLSTFKIKRELSVVSFRFPVRRNLPKTPRILNWQSPVAQAVKPVPDAGAVASLGLVHRAKMLNDAEN
jgi:hypothetical protein